MVFEKRKRPDYRKGFSLIELIVAVAAAMVLILGIGITLAHSQQAYTTMFKRAHSDVVEEAYEARRVFDRVVRKATTRRCDLIDGSTIYVYYYSDTPQTPNYTLVDPDRFAKFYVASSMLLADHGDVPPGWWADSTSSPGSLAKSRTEIIAQNVQMDAGKSIFSVQGRTVHMAMTLVKTKKNGMKESMFLTSSGVRHNK
ncbi:MAG: PilW family protein [Planctomycetota bacterium]